MNYKIRKIVLLVTLFLIASIFTQYITQESINIRYTFLLTVIFTTGLAIGEYTPGKLPFKKDKK
ncbi:hypothetical protein [Carnobacterium sp.]|uniref:hypothetical protein n=1 Tax=Carnobacterium sp. TaxID=48221 RepID=UPI003C72190C